MGNLIRLSKVDEQPGFPLKASTLYKWKHTRKHPQIFVKLGGALFVDMDQLAKLVENSRCK